MGEPARADWADEPEQPEQPTAATPPPALEEPTVAEGGEHPVARPVRRPATGARRTPRGTTAGRAGTAPGASRRRGEDTQPTRPVSARTLRTNGPSRPAPQAADGRPGRGEHPGDSATRRRGGSGGNGSRTTGGSGRGKSSITTRAALLGLTISAIALLLALPVRTYLSQHDEITATAKAQADQRHRIAVLQQEVKRDSDPAYIEQQARLRLQLTMPGQKDYVVIPTPKKAAPKPKVGTSTAVVPAPDTNQTWFSALWSTDVEAASPAPKK